MRPQQLVFFLLSVLRFKFYYSVFGNTASFGKKQEVCFENEFSVSRVFNHSSIIVGNILETTIIPSDVSPFINNKFFHFYFLLNFELSSLDDSNQIWLLKSFL